MQQKYNEPATVGRAIPSEWHERMKVEDPVMRFIETVNERAVAHPDWNTDYRYAHYEAFVKEAGRYVGKKLDEFEQQQKELQR